LDGLLGITVLSVLDIIGGGFFLFMGLAVTIIGQMIARAMSSLRRMHGRSPVSIAGASIYLAAEHHGDNIAMNELYTSYMNTEMSTVSTLRALKSILGVSDYAEMADGLLKIYEHGEIYLRGGELHGCG